MVFSLCFYFRMNNLAGWKQWGFSFPIMLVEYIHIIGIGCAHNCINALLDVEYNMTHFVSSHHD